MNGVNFDAYPMLKPEVRLKRLPQFCWVIDRDGDINESLTPLEAFLLANCSGNFNVWHIAYIYEKVFETDKENAVQAVSDIISRRNGILIWLSRAEQPVVMRYNPADFLYKPEQAEIVERCETPCEMFFSITHSCNFRCIYCFNAAALPAKQELTTKEWLSVIEQGASLGVMRCTITGGEPLIREDFFTILEALDYADMLTCVCTNGSLVTGELIKKLKRLRNPPLIQVSLDSAADSVFDHLTQTYGFFDQVIQTLRALCEAGLSVQVKTVLTPVNIDGIDSLIDCCAEIGIDRLILDRFSLSSCGRGDTRLLVPDEKIEELRQRIPGMCRNLKALDIRVTNQRDRWVSEADAVPCGALRRSFIVLPDGDVSVCEKLIGIPEMTVGNIRHTSVADIWRSQAIQNILFQPKERYDSICRECSVFESCRSGCYALKYFLGMEPYTVDPRCYKRNMQENVFL